MSDASLEADRPSICAARAPRERTPRCPRPRRDPFASAGALALETTTTRGREWRCGACGALLGRVTDGVLDVRLRGASYEIVGSVRACCRRCGATSELGPAG